MSILKQFKNRIYYYWSHVVLFISLELAIGRFCYETSYFQKTRLARFWWSCFGIRNSSRIWRSAGFFLQTNSATVSFENLNFPDFASDSGAYPFSWINVTSFFRLLVKSNFFLRWETIQKYYPNVLLDLNKELPYYLTAEGIRTECFFNEEIKITHNLLQKLDLLLLEEFQIFLLERLEKDPFILFHLFFTNNVQSVLIEQFLKNNVPYLLSRYSTVDYLQNLRYYVSQPSLVTDIWHVCLIDSTWSQLFYFSAIERVIFFLSQDFFASRVFGLGNMPFYSVWTTPRELFSSPVFIITFSCFFGAIWYFFYARLDYRAYQAETYQNMTGLPAPAASFSIFSLTYWRNRYLYYYAQVMRRYFNIQYPDNFMVFYSTPRLRYRQEFIARAPLTVSHRDIDFFVIATTILLCARHAGYLRLLKYKRKDFSRTIRHYYKRHNRRLVSQYRTAVSPIVALAEIRENRPVRPGFAPLRKSNDYPLVWRSRLARQYWVPYRARKRLVTTRRLERLLTKYLNHMHRPRALKYRHKIPTFVRFLRDRSSHGFAQEFRRPVRKRFHRSRFVHLMGTSNNNRRFDRFWLRHRPRLYGGYLRAGTDQRFDVFTIIDPTDTLLTWHKLQLEDSAWSLPYAYQRYFDSNSQIQDCTDLLDIIGRDGFNALFVPDFTNVVNIPGWQTYSQVHKYTSSFFHQPVITDPFLNFDLYSLYTRSDSSLNVIDSWSNTYARNREVSEYLYNVVYQQRWILANELLNTLYINTLTQDRSRILMPRLAWQNQAFIRYFSFYNKQLKYNFGFKDVNLPIVLGERISNIVRKPRSYSVGLKKPDVVNLSFVRPTFYRFIAVGWHRKVRPKRLRFFLEGRNYYRPRRKYKFRRKLRRYKSLLSLKSRSWRRLFRHKHVWRLTSALKSRRVSLMPDEIQRNRQQGAIYSFIVSSDRLRLKKRKHRTRRKLSRLFRSRRVARSRKFLRRSHERKLFRLLLVRRSRRWRRLFSKYAFFSVPRSKKDRKRFLKARFRGRVRRHFFYPWRRDKTKGLLAKIKYIPERLTFSFRQLGFGALARWRLRNWHDREGSLLFSNKKQRWHVRRWKLRRTIHRGSFRSLFPKYTKFFLSPKSKNLFAIKKKYRRVLNVDRIRLRRERARWSVKRHRLRRMRRPYRIRYSFNGKKKRQMSLFWKQFRTRFEKRPLGVPEKEKQPWTLLNFPGRVVDKVKEKADKAYESTKKKIIGLWKKKHPPRNHRLYLQQKKQKYKLNVLLAKETAISRQLRHASYFRSAVVSDNYLQRLKRRALLAFSARHKYQYLVLRKKIRLLHSLPFFRTNRRKLRSWSFGQVVKPRFNPLMRLVLHDLHQRFRFGIIPNDRVQTDLSRYSDQRLCNYFVDRFSYPVKFSAQFSLKRSIVSKRTPGVNLYYSFGQSAGRQYFRILPVTISTSTSLPFLWNDLTNNNRFILRFYFEEAIKIVGDKPANRLILEDDRWAGLVGDYSLQSTFKEFYTSRVSINRTISFFHRSRNRAISSIDTGVFGQTFDDRLWHAFPYRLHKDRMKKLRRRSAKRRHFVVEFFKKDWYELFNDYCHDWEFGYNVSLGRRSDIIDEHFLMETRGYDPHFKLIKRAEVSDLAVLAETHAFHFKLASLFPYHISPWRSVFRIRKRLRLLPNVPHYSMNGSVSFRRYRRSFFYRFRRLGRVAIGKWTHFQRLSTVFEFLRQSFVNKNTSFIDDFKFRKSKNNLRKMMIFRGVQSVYANIELWKLRRHQNYQLMVHIRAKRRSRRFGLFLKDLFFKERWRSWRRTNQKAQFRVRWQPKRTGLEGSRRQRKTRRQLRAAVKHQFKNYPLPKRRNHRFYNYKSTRGRAPILFRSSLFAKTRYYLSLQQEILAPRLLPYIRRDKIAKLYLPSTFLSKNNGRSFRYLRRRYFGSYALYHPRYKKISSKFHSSRKKAWRMRWLRNKAIRYLRRAYLNPEFDGLTRRFRFRPYQFKVVPVEQLPQISKRSVILSVHNFSEYMTPKWRDLLGIMDSFQYFDYKYMPYLRRKSEAGLSDQEAWLKRNNFKIDEDLIFTTGTANMEFESRIFSHYMPRYREWDLVPFSIDNKIISKRARFTWLQRYLARSLGTRTHRRRGNFFRRNRNRLSWILFYQQFLSNSVVKQNFISFLKWHRLSRQLHIVWRRKRRRLKRRAIRYRRRRQFFFFSPLFNSVRFRIRVGRKRTDSFRDRYRLRKIRRRWELYTRPKRGYKVRWLANSAYRVAFRLIGKRRKRSFKLPHMKYGFWAKMRYLQNKVRLGDAINFINFRFFYAPQPVQAVSNKKLHYQLALNVFEYRKFSNRLTGKLRRRPRSVFLGRSATWKTRALWFNADKILFDRPLARGQRLGRPWRYIGGRRKKKRVMHARYPLVRLFRRAATVLNLIRGQTEVYQSYLHRFTTRYSLRYKVRMDFPKKKRVMKKAKIRRRRNKYHLHRAERISTTQATIADLIRLQRQKHFSEGLSNFGLISPLFSLKARYVRSQKPRVLRIPPRRRRRVLRNLRKFSTVRTVSRIRLEPGFKTNIQFGHRREIYYRKPRLYIPDPKIRVPRDKFEYRRLMYKIRKCIIFMHFEKLPYIGRFFSLLKNESTRYSWMWKRNLRNNPWQFGFKRQNWKRLAFTRKWQKLYFYNNRRKARRLGVFKRKFWVERRLLRQFLRKRLIIMHRSLRFIKRKKAKTSMVFLNRQRWLQQRRFRRKLRKKLIWVTTWMQRQREIALWTPHQRYLARLKHRKRLRAVAKKLEKKRLAFAKVKFSRNYKAGQLRFRKRIRSFFRNPTYWLHQSYPGTVAEPRRDRDIYIDLLAKPGYLFSRLQRRRKFKRFIRTLKRSQLVDYRFKVGLLKRKQRFFKKLAMINSQNQGLWKTGKNWYSARALRDRYARLRVKKFLYLFWDNIETSTRPRRRFEQYYRSIVFRYDPKKIYYKRRNKHAFSFFRYSWKMPIRKFLRFGPTLVKKLNVVMAERGAVLLLDHLNRVVFRRKRLSQVLRDRRKARAKATSHRFLVKSQVTFDSFGLPHKIKVKQPRRRPKIVSIIDIIERKPLRIRRLRGLRPALKRPYLLHKPIFQKPRDSAMLNQWFVFKKSKKRFFALTGKRADFNTSYFRSVKNSVFRQSSLMTKIQSFLEYRQLLYRKKEPKSKFFLRPQFRKKNLNFYVMDRRMGVRFLAGAFQGHYNDYTKYKINQPIRRKARRWSKIRYKGLRKFRRFYWWVRKNSIRNKLLYKSLKYRKHRRITAYRRKYKRFKKRFRRRLWLKRARQRNRRRFLVFKRFRRRATLFQTKHQYRKYDWVTRRLSPRYVREMAYFTSFNRLSLATVKSSIRVPNMALSLEGFRSPEYWKNLRVVANAAPNSQLIDIYTSRQKRILAQAHSANSVPLGWAFLLRSGENLTFSSKVYTTNRWQFFSDVMGGFQGRSSQIMLWLLSGYAATKTLLSKELFIAQFLTQTLGYIVGTPSFDASYVLAYWFSAWWDAIAQTFWVKREPLVLPLDIGLEDPYFLQQYIRQQEIKFDFEAWVGNISSGVENMTQINVLSNYFEFSKTKTPTNLAVKFSRQVKQQFELPSFSANDLIVNTAHTMVSSSKILEQKKKITKSLPYIYKELVKQKVVLPSYFIWDPRHKRFELNVSKVLKILMTSNSKIIKDTINPRLLSIDLELLTKPFGQRSMFDRRSYAPSPILSDTSRMLVPKNNRVLQTSSTKWWRNVRPPFLEPEYEILQWWKIAGPPDEPDSHIGNTPPILWDIWSSEPDERDRLSEALSGLGLHMSDLSDTETIVDVNDVFYKLPRHIGAEPSQEMVDNWFDPKSDEAFFHIAKTIKSFQKAEPAPTKPVTKSAKVQLLQNTDLDKVNLTIDEIFTPSVQSGSVDELSTDDMRTPRTDEIFTPSLHSDEVDFGEDHTPLSELRQRASQALEALDAFAAQHPNYEIFDDELIAYEQRSDEELVAYKHPQPRSQPQPQKITVVPDLIIPPDPNAPLSDDEELVAYKHPQPRSQPQPVSRSQPQPVSKVYNDDDDDEVWTLIEEKKDPDAELHKALHRPVPFSLIGDLVFMDTNGLNMFQVYAVISESENASRMRDGFSPRLTHESLRETALQQQAERQRFLQVAYKIAAKLREDFVLAGIQPEYIPTPPATDLEFAEYMGLHAEPFERRITPFLDRIAFLKMCQESGKDPASIKIPELEKRPMQIKESAFSMELQLTPGARYVPVYPSGVGINGVCLKVRMAGDAEFDARQRLVQEILRGQNLGFVSLAIWEYIEYMSWYGEHGDWLPDWSLNRIGHPPEWLKTDCRLYGVGGTFAEVVSVRNLLRHLSIPVLHIRDTVRDRSYNFEHDPKRLEWQNGVRPNPLLPLSITEGRIMPKYPPKLKLLPFPEEPPRRFRPVQRRRTRQEMSSLIMRLMAQRRAQMAEVAAQDMSYEEYEELMSQPKAYIFDEDDFYEPTQAQVYNEEEDDFYDYADESQPVSRSQPQPVSRSQPQPVSRSQPQPVSKVYNDDDDFYDYEDEDDVVAITQEPQPRRTGGRPLFNPFDPIDVELRQQRYGFLEEDYIDEFLDNIFYPDGKKKEEKKDN